MGLRFTHDAAGDIIGIEDAVHPERTQVFKYDALSRLTAADGGYGLLGFVTLTVSNEFFRILHSYEHNDAVAKFHSALA